jgi:hypothetical protein
LSAIRPSNVGKSTLFIIWLNKIAIVSKLKPPATALGFLLQKKQWLFLGFESTGLLVGEW